MLRIIGKSIPFCGLREVPAQSSCRAFPQWHPVVQRLRVSDCGPVAFPAGVETDDAHTGMIGLENLFQALRISQEVIDAYSVNAFIVVESAHIVTRDDDFAEFIANELEGTEFLSGFGFVW